MSRYQINVNAVSVSVDGIEYQVSDGIIEVPDVLIPQLADAGVTLTSIPDDAAADKAAADKAAAGGTKK